MYRALACVGMAAAAFACVSCGRSANTCPPSAATTASHDGASQRAAPPDTAATRVLTAWLAAFHRGDVRAATEMFAPDGVMIGAGWCKGNPCVGHKDISDGWISPSSEGGLTMEVSILRANDREVYASWTARAPDERRGVDHIRGWLLVTVEGGRIVRWDNSYDIADPETAIYRWLQGEVPFALRHVGAGTSSPARVLLFAKDDDTAIVVYLNDAVATPGLARLQRGTCDKPGAIAHELRAFRAGRSDSQLAVKLDALVAEPMSLTVANATGAIVLCGDVPGPPRRVSQPG